jgi:hypothetical protein
MAPVRRLVPGLVGTGVGMVAQFADDRGYNVIRESPPWEVPMRCGAIKPY